MTGIRSIRTGLLIVITLAAFSVTACSRKSGCPSEDVHIKLDKEGNPKPGKTTSGLLPPKASKKRKN